MSGEHHGAHGGHGAHRLHGAAENGHSSRNRIFAAIPVVAMLALLVSAACGEAPLPSQGSGPIAPVALDVVDTATLPGNSLHHLPHAWTDGHGSAFVLSAFRGERVVLAMFYASCKTVCPRTLNGLRSVQDLLPADARARTRFLLVSLDPARDTPVVLARVASDYGLDDRWTLASGSEDATRELAAVLAIRYRAEGGGEIGHTPIVTVLDEEGVPGFVTPDPASDRLRLAEALRG